MPHAAVARVAFQGELGAYSEEAVHRLFGEGAEAVPMRDFAAVGRAVAQSTVDAGILPVENTLAGAVVGSLDVVGDAALQLRAIGEMVLPIRHCVLGLPGSRIDRLRQVRSHPVALAQCGRFFERTGIEAVATYDTAGAALEVQRAGDRSVAAIASEVAASRYGLEVLQADIADRYDNQTRFLAVVGPGAEVPAVVRAKTLLVAQVENVPGALLRLLATFADRGINLSRLDARPGTEPWTHRFFLEVEVDSSTPEGLAALDAARASALSLRLLGSFAPFRER